MEGQAVFLLQLQKVAVVNGMPAFLISMWVCVPFTILIFSQSIPKESAPTPNLTAPTQAAEFPTHSALSLSLPNSSQLLIGSESYPFPVTLELPV